MEFGLFGELESDTRTKAAVHSSAPHLPCLPIPQSILLEQPPANPVDSSQLGPLLLWPFSVTVPLPPPEPRESESLPELGLRFPELQ